MSPKKLIYSCVFHNQKYVHLVELLLKSYKLFGNQVFALGTINLYKFKHMNRAIISFIIAISSELIIIIAMAWARAIPFLVQKFPNLNNFIN